MRERLAQPRRPKESGYETEPEKATCVECRATFRL